MKKLLCCTVVFSCLTMAGAQAKKAAPKFTGPVPTGPTAIIDTTAGQMSCKLFDKQAPIGVENFIGLAQGTKEWKSPTNGKSMKGTPLYNGTIFHRVIPNFMIQGGDPSGTGACDPGFTFEDEFDPNLNFDVPGRLAMANSGPNTNGTQFFITEVPTEYLNQKHTIFGQCDEPSVNLVKAIARVERDPSDKPVTPVVLKKVTIVPEGELIPIPKAPPSGPETEIRHSGPPPIALPQPSMPPPQP
jgi:peptidyl-prolyl cis-trans isomerase A (cyclophilin A)